MRSKMIRADKRYLLLPIGDSGGWFLPVEKTQYLGIYRNGELLEEHELILDPAPRTWSSVCCGLVYLLVHWCHKQVDSNE